MTDFIETDNSSGWNWLRGEVGLPELTDPVEAKIAEVRSTPRQILAETVDLN